MNGNALLPSLVHNLAMKVDSLERQNRRLVIALFGVTALASLAMLVAFLAYKGGT